MKRETIKTVVREGYARIAGKGDPCCGPVESCCGGPDPAQDMSKKIGYTDEDLRMAPNGANLGLGCGNPVALATLKKGETVLDLGSGAGFDCFLAAKRVGEKGRVIGVDMTPEMIDKARENARRERYQNVEFRLGEIENLPAADQYVDAVISNCVINLSPEKHRVFEEAFRVLKPGGKLMVSDIVLLKELPDCLRDSINAYVGCVSGAIKKKEYLDAIEAAGFEEVKIMEETPFPVDLLASDPVAESILESLEIPPKKMKDFDGTIASISVCGVKPGGD
jgi:SAM-dependent methyltransferase